MARKWVVVLLILLGHLASRPAHTASIGCPRALHRHLFEQPSLFNGDPARLADIIPIYGKWDVSRPATFPEGYFLVCQYEGTQEVRTLHVPASAKFCDIDGFCR